MRSSFINRLVLIGVSRHKEVNKVIEIFRVDAHVVDGDRRNGLHCRQL
jgi:hypothetical protein